jgi:exo-1,4-beta-D-glucosaminidase
MRTSGVGFLTCVALAATAVAADAQPSRRQLLKEGWTLHSSAGVRADGATLSMPGVDVRGWHVVSVPNTVVGALVENGEYEDPYFGMNLRKIPGTTYPIGERFTLLPMPADSPFKPSWWYRKEFEIVTRGSGLGARGSGVDARGSGPRAYWLHFDAINYRANIWLNGHRIADAKTVAGAFRRYEFDVTEHVRVPGPNVLAVEVFAPEPHDLSIMWVDWNPTPADKNMGLWGDVYLTETGRIALRHPFITSDLKLPSLDSATVSVSAEAWNTTDAPVIVTVRGQIGGAEFSQTVTLASREHKTLTFDAPAYPQLTMASPRLWWPYRLGPQNLHTLVLTADVDGVESDRQEVTFGIQKITSELTKEGHRLFRINGKPLLIRGGGWASDMLLRPKSRERLEAELRYTREMGLNTIRLEGKLETDEFYELADRYGILVMAGWCCCDQWEKWKEWDAEDYRVGPASLRDQILRLRNHPSILVWLNGSDFPPPAKVEREYLSVLKDLRWPKPILSNATDAPGPVSGPSGVKMRGPYDYVPPSYWLTDKKHGGAFGFATEIGPGAAVPPIETLERMMPRDRLWPMNEFWTFHAGGDEFKDLRLFTDALYARYGKAANAGDYARKAQALAYEGERAMFEAYGRNKYTSTGVIQWMLNNAWPSMIWHLYDYYLRPGGGYFGTKKACEPVHVQYSYDDRSVAIVNDGPQPATGLKVAAQLFDLNLVSKFSRERTLDVAADAVATVFPIPEPAGVSGAYFLRLTVTGADSNVVSRNFYWLSTQPDVLDWAKTEWYYTPVKSHADFTALATLPSTTLDVTRRPGQPGQGGASESGDASEIVTVENTGRSLAFQVRLKIVDAPTGNEILPVFWEDNYFELMPGEKREIGVAWPRQAGGNVAVEAEAWNVARARHD